ncbi:MAG TPA: MarP family serine protease [Acidimicrobiales bacterium]|nr:MarP family serine protease [Acidimicrobiales bacterium]
MDWVDVVLILVVVAAAVHGLRLGALLQVFTFGGFLLGMVLGMLLSVAIGSSIHSQGVRVAVVLLLVLGLAILFGIGGRVLGSWSTVAARRRHLGSVDSVLGVAVAVVAVLVSAWLVAYMLSQSRFVWLSSAIQRSDVLKAVDDVMPPPPDVFTPLQTFLSNSGFPPVFVGISPAPARPVATPSGSEADLIGSAAEGSMVKVLGQACGYLQEGSGFVVAPGLVVTNAHVVAGEPSTEVVVQGVPYPATAVLFDPNFDLAVLRTRAPLGPPLDLDPDEVGRGTQGAVLGYPKNGPLVIGPAGVASSLTAEGRDIYNKGTVVRSVYQVDANVQPGNSGGPVVQADGTVIGVVFSRSTVSADVGYALASPGVLARVQQAELRPTAVSTGACVQS